MKTALFIIPLALLIAACARTELVPQVYMPAPPEILMRAPQELNTIRSEPETKQEAVPRDD